MATEGILGQPGLHDMRVYDPRPRVWTTLVSVRACRTSPFLQPEGLFKTHCDWLLSPICFLFKTPNKPRVKRVTSLVTSLCRPLFAGSKSKLVTVASFFFPRLKKEDRCMPDSSPRVFEPRGTCQAPIIPASRCPLQPK